MRKVIKKIEKRIKKLFPHTKDTRVVRIGILLVIILAIPLTVFIVQKQQDIREHAQEVGEKCFYQETYEGKPVINVKNFGAIGDGQTDESVAIQNALNCFKSDEEDSSGGAVFIPAGIYRIDKKIRVFSNVTLFGDGIDETILDATSAIGDETPLMGNDSNRGQKNITIRDMTMKGYWDGTGEVLKIENLDGGLIYNVKLERAKYGLLLGFHDGKGTMNVRVSDCQVNNTRTRAIFLSLGENNVIDNCVIDSQGSDSLGIGLEIGSEGKISNNRVISNSVSNGGHSYSATAGNDTNYDPSWINSDNIFCYNTASGNHVQPMWDQRGKNNVYIGNNVEVSNVNSFGFEEKAGTDARCEIPGDLATIPQPPPKPAIITEGTPIVPSKVVTATVTVSPSTGPSGTITPTATVSATPIASGSATPTPTVTPTQTPQPTPTNTIVPTPTLPSTPTLVGLTVTVPGIGSKGNKTPNNSQRTVVVTLVDGASKVIGAPVKSTVAFDPGSGAFKGTVNFGTVIPTGNYTTKIKMDQYLIKKVTAGSTITAGILNQLPQVGLIVGDINNDNKLDILDYNILVGCFGSKINSQTCGNKKVDTDLNDDGVINGVDYNLFLLGIKTAKVGD